MRELKVRSNNGSCCIRFTLTDGSTHSLTLGSYTNPSDMARMQRIALEVRESVLAGTFTGLEQYKPTKVKATVQALLDKLQDGGDYPHRAALIKLLQYRHDKPLNVKVIQECFDNGTQSVASKRRYLSALRGVFQEHSKHFAVTMSNATKTVCKRDPFTDTEVKQILNVFNDSIYLSIVRFQLLTGCRPSEAFALRWCDIEVSENRIRIAHSVTRKSKNKERVRKDTKTGKVRYFPMNSDLIILLQSINPIAYGSDSKGLIFTNSNGEMISDQSYRDVWERAIAGSTVRYRPPYTCRHTFISHCLARGVDVATVASWVGNSPEIIYKHYAGTINHASVPSLY